MKYFLPLLLICFRNTTFSQVKIQKSSLTEIKEHLLSLEKNWLKAEFALDTSYLSSIIDSTFTDISEEGIHDKNESLQSMYNNISQRLKDSIVVDSFNLENTIVKIYDNAAVVIFTVHTHGKNKQAVTDRKTRFYDVWIKRNNEWKAVSSQGSNVEE